MRISGVQSASRRSASFRELSSALLSFSFWFYFVFIFFVLVSFYFSLFFVFVVVFVDENHTAGSQYRLIGQAGRLAGIAYRQPPAL